MRLEAAKKHLGWIDMMCAVLPAHTEPDKLRQIIQKDNSSFGEFDYDLLREDWMDFGYDYDAWGLHFDTQEIELEPKEAKDDNFDVDRAVEALKEPVTKRGDIWQLGRHFLMCGDSTSAEDVERLKAGASHYFTEDRTQCTVVDEWPDFDKMDKASLRDFCKRVFDRDALATDIIRERNAEHPTMKPIPLMGRFVRNSTRRGGQVIDLFGGSGSTLMACEQLDRTCRTMEYDPRYCDVIIARWEKYTGRKATKID